MKILLTIYLIISLLTFGFIYLCSRFVAKKFKTEHPTAKFRKVGCVEKVIAFLRTVIVSFCPIINIVFLLVFVLAWEQCVEATEDKVWDLVEEE